MCSRLLGLVLAGVGWLALGVSVTQAQTFAPTPGPYTANVYAAVRYGYDPITSSNIELGSVEYMALVAPRASYTPFPVSSGGVYATLPSYGRISQVPVVESQRPIPDNSQRFLVVPGQPIPPELPFGFRYRGTSRYPYFLR